MTRRRAATAILALFSGAAALGCLFGNAAPSGAPEPPRRGRGLAILDPLDWSGRYLEAQGLRLERRDGAVRLPFGDAERTADALAGALLALRRRMAVIAENVAAAETSRLPGPAAPGAAPQPYRRKLLAVTTAGALETQTDDSPFRRAYRPGHPDADKDGFVSLPNVYVAVELGDWRASQREYEALRLALAALSAHYAAPPAEFLPEPAPPPAYEEKTAPPARPPEKSAPAAKPE